MKTRTLIIFLIITTAIFSYFTVRKMKANASRDYKVLIWKELKICFLIGPEYKITKTENGFSYIAGKNSGAFTIHNTGLDPKKKKSSFGDFKGAYSKEIDFRTFEYLISENLIIRDRFDFAKKNFANLLPVKNNCSKYLDRFPVLFEF